MSDKLQVTVEFPNTESGRISCTRFFEAALAWMHAEGFRQAGVVKVNPHFGDQPEAKDSVLEAAEAFKEEG